MKKLVIKENKKGFITNNSRKPYIIVILFVTAVYLQVIGFSYTGFDDDFLVVNNIEKLSDFGNIDDIFTGNSFLSDAVYGFYRPIQTLSFIIDTSIGGGSLWMFHLTNFLLHCMVSCLILVLLKRLKFDAILSFIAVLIFSVHPLFAVDIAWLPARGDLLIAVFCISSFIMFLKFLDTNKYHHLFIHTVLLFIAFLSKETAVLFPSIFVLYLLFSKRKLFNKELLLVYFLWLSIFGIWFVLRSGSVQDFPGNQIFGLIPFIENLSSFPEYISKFFLPYNLMPLPIYQLVVTAIGAFIILVFIILYFYKKNFNKFNFLLGLAWFVILILPGMFYGRYYPKSEQFYHYLDHRTYLPFVGILILLIELFGTYLKKIRARRLVISGIIISLLLSLISFNHVKIFSSPEKFLNAATEANPNASVAYFLKGNISKDAGDYTSAVKDYSEAISIDNEYAEALNNRGSLYGMAGEYEKSINDLRKAIQLDPSIPDGYFNRAIARDATGDYQGAIEDFTKSLSLNPNDYLIFYLRANSYAAIGRNKKALTDYNMAINLNPDYVKAYINRGIERYKLSDVEGACSDWKKAAEMGSPDALQMMKKYCSKKQF
ncbi:tetratricopeptide repeat protein [Bacteroidota bacterium]